MYRTHSFFLFERTVATGMELWEENPCTLAGVIESVSACPFCLAPRDSACSIYPDGDGDRQPEPLAVTKREAFRIIAMPKLVQRWLYHGWLEVVRRGGPGRETVIDYKSLVDAYERFRRGESPPPLPSERKTRSGDTAPLDDESPCQKAL
jgi:hypothetical protein